MRISEILVQIDHEIAQFQQAHTLLGGGSRVDPQKAVATHAAKKPAREKRNLTPEGRKHIAEAVKRYWAEQMKSPAK